MSTGPQRLDPEQVAEHLDSLGETTAALLLRAQARELTVVRGERDALATHIRSIAVLPATGTSYNGALIAAAKKALDALRVTKRCPVATDRRHAPVETRGVTRCRLCHTRVPRRT